MRLQIFFGPNCACYVVIMAWLRIVLRLYCARNDANANSLMGASALTHNLSLVTHMSMLIVSDFISYWSDVLYVHYSLHLFYCLSS